ncbi:NAD(P) transhydrogenase subunit alpha [Alphaproteobacteria bacterium]|nr:NAD(P) transhydrogenase subunit alpha [Alphaproteobacteria bacterium]
MKLFVLKEPKWEHRVSVTPDAAKFLSKFGSILVEKSAGERAGFSDDDYKSVGCVIVKQRDIGDADVVFGIGPIRCLDSVNGWTIIICLQEPYENRENLRLAKEKNLAMFSLELIPRSTRAQYMDVLSSQSSLAGYKAAIESAHFLRKGLPLMMTTAGTVPAAKVLVIGAGVAGLQAIATAKRLGAIVSAFDVRTSAKEQVESIGAKFVEVESVESEDGIYATEMTASYQTAQEAKLRSVIPAQDIIITTAQIPGKKAPIIIKKDMVATMKRGSVLIDLASKTGGNCELTKHGETVSEHGVLIISFDNILNLIAYDASRLFAKNVSAFFELLSKEMEKTKNLSQIEEEIIKSTLLTFDGEIVNEKFKGVCL